MIDILDLNVNMQVNKYNNNLICKSFDIYANVFEIT